MTRQDVDTISGLHPSKTQHHHLPSVCNILQHKSPMISTCFPPKLIDWDFIFQSTVPGTRHFASPKNVFFSTNTLSLIKVSVCSIRSMARNRTDVLAEYSELIETIRKIKREKHSKRVEFELILESYGDDCESVRILIDKLVRNGVLLLEMDNRSRKMISTTDVDVHTVLETLCETSEENNSDERKSVKIVREESRWLDDKMENDDRDIQNSTNRDAFTCYMHDHNSIERDAFPCFDDENDYITKKDLRLHTREITKKFESVLKEITIGNAMIYEKFENYQKELLQGKLNSLHEAVQEKTSELRRLSVECDAQKTTAPNTPDSDIPSRQPCNISSFS